MEKLRNNKNIYQTIRIYIYMPKFLDVHSLKGFEDEEMLRKIATVSCG
jgi:hypothetical protein